MPTKYFYFAIDVSVIVMSNRIYKVTKNNTFVRGNLFLTF